MYQIESIPANARQRRTLILPDGKSIEFAIYFASLQFGWYIRELKYLDFTINGLRITNSPNMLHQYRNQLPFGLACVSTQDREPTQQQDFSSGASKLYILTEEEVATYAGILSGEV